MRSYFSPLRISIAATLGILIGTNPSLGQINHSSATRFDRMLRKFLLQNQSRYVFSNEDERDQLIDADIEKIREVAIKFVQRNPKLILDSCAFKYKGSQTFEYKGIRSGLYENQLRRISKVISEGQNPDTLAIFAGRTTSNFKLPNQIGIEGVHLQNNFASWQEKLRNKIKVIEGMGLEVKSARVAVKHFKRWGVSKKTLEIFLQELEIPLQVVSFEDVLKINGKFFKLENGPSEDPKVDLSVSYSLIGIECSEQFEPFSKHGLTLNFYGATEAPLGIEADNFGAFIRDYPNLFRNQTDYYLDHLDPESTEDLNARADGKFSNNQHILHSALLAVQHLLKDYEIDDIREEIEFATNCGVMIALEIRKVGSELNRLVPHVSTSVGIGSAIVVQGDSGPATPFIKNIYIVDPFVFRDLQPGQRGFSTRQRFKDMLLHVLETELARKTKCVRPSSRKVSLY